MNIFQIVPPDFRTNFKCQLTEDVATGEDTISVDSTEGFSIGSFIVVGNINAPNTEMLRVIALPSSTTVKFNRALRYIHLIDTFVTVSLFDSFNIYFGSTADISAHQLLINIPIVVTRGITTHVDTVIEHGPNTFYSFTYFNSFNNNQSNRFPIIASGLDTEITPQFIKETYLYGLDLTEDDGQPLPDSVYWEGIKAAFGWLEQVLQIDILPRTYIEEASDFRREEYMQWVFLKTKHFPVKEVTSVKGTYYGNDITFPLDWVRLKERAGIVNLVPGGSAFSTFLIPATGGILPILNNQMSFIPGFWKLNYSTGFRSGEIPYNIKDFICKRACFMPLNILGDLVGGVGVSSKSIGLDGLSQSAVYTNSAENHGYSARLRMYTAEIKAELPSLITYWRPVTFITL